MTRDERLLAYVDGELVGEELATFEAEIAADPDLAAEVEKHRGLAGRLAAAHAERAEIAGQGKSKSRPKSNAAPQGAAASPRLSILHWAAIVVGLAAGIAAGVAGGRYLWPEQGPVVATGGVLMASGALERALSGQLASEKGPVTIPTTFRTAKGQVCRTFASQPDSLAGVACRQSDGGWGLQTTTVLGLPGAMPRAVSAAVEGLIAGIPLDAAAERAARDKNWK